MTTLSPSSSLQAMILALERFWAERGCVLQQPYPSEVGAGTFNPATFLRALGPEPWRVGYVEPSRRPKDGRYGENPNRFQQFFQYQVLLKPAPGDVVQEYFGSLEAIGIDPREHDLRLIEDDWESPTLGAAGLGWQVLMDGTEISQFTYFQQCGGLDLDPISAEITYGLERIAAFLQNVPSVYDIRWSNDHSYGELRLEEELELSVYDFEAASPAACRTLLDTYEAEALRLLASAKELKDPEARRRFPLRKVYELCLKCSHLFNILDARGAISVTERVALIARIRRMATQVARIYVDRLKPVPVEAETEVQTA